MATKFSNSRFTETVENETSTVKLYGEVTYNADKLIGSFSGSVTTIDGSKTGNFNYSETSDGNVSRGYNGPKEIEIESCDLVDATVVDIKNRTALSL